MAVQAPLRAPYPYPVPSPEGARISVCAGFDLGSKFGWGLVDLGGRMVDSGVWDFSHRGRESKTDPGARVLRAINMIGGSLQQWEARYRLAGVCYEIVRRHEGVQAAHVYGGLEWIVLAQCSRLSIDVSTAEVAALKIIATSKGNSNKEAMVKAAGRRWGIDPRTADVADALFAADMLRRRVTGAVL